MKLENTKYIQQIIAISGRPCPTPLPALILSCPLCLPCPASCACPVPPPVPTLSHLLLSPCHALPSPCSSLCRPLSLLPGKAESLEQRGWGDRWWRFWVRTWGWVSGTGRCVVTRQDLPHVWACSCSLVGQNPEAVRQSCWFWDGSTWGRVSGVGDMWGHLAAYHVAQQNVVAWGTVVGCWCVGAGGTSWGCGGVWCLCIVLRGSKSPSRARAERSKP